MSKSVKLATAKEVESFTQAVGDLWNLWENGMMTAFGFWMSARETLHQKPMGVAQIPLQDAGINQGWHKVSSKKAQPLCLSLALSCTHSWTALWPW